MPQRHEYSDGAPCWTDLSTPDLGRAQRFYGELFGWQFDEPDPRLGGYANIRKDGKRVAGMMPMMPGQLATVWTVHLKSSDIDTSEQRITAAGGRVLVKYGLPELGTTMIAVDPTGATFGVWQPGAHTGAELVDEPGAMCWHELYTRDPEAADHFYRAVFGHEQRRMEGDGDIDYMIYSRDGQGVAGRMKMTAEFGAAPPRWETFFAVVNLDAALAKLGPLAGKSMFGPIETPYGRVAKVADPHGAMFAIIELTDP